MTINASRVSRRTWIRILLSCFTGLGLVAFAAGIAEAAPGWDLMSGTWGSWTLYNQQNKNWCWAGTTQMAIKRVKGTAPSQCDIVKYTRSSPDCLDGPQALSTLNRTFTNWGVASSYSSAPPTFAAVKNLTDNSGGALVQINWQNNSNTAHVATVMGTSSTSTITVYNIQEKSVSSYGSMTFATFTGGSAALFGTPYTVAQFIGASK
jgi:hypothetical protein